MLHLSLGQILQHRIPQGFVAKKMQQRYGYGCCFVVAVSVVVAVAFEHVIVYVVTVVMEV